MTSRPTFTGPSLECALLMNRLRYKAEVSFATSSTAIVPAPKKLEGQYHIQTRSKLHTQKGRRDEIAQIGSPQHLRKEWLH